MPTLLPRPQQIRILVLRLPSAGVDPDIIDGPSNMSGRQIISGDIKSKLRISRRIRIQIEAYRIDCNARSHKRITIAKRDTIVRIDFAVVTIMGHQIADVIPRVSPIKAIFQHPAVIVGARPAVKSMIMGEIHIGSYRHSDVGSHFGIGIDDDIVAKIGPQAPLPIDHG